MKNEAMDGYKAQQASSKKIVVFMVNRLRRFQCLPYAVVNYSAAVHRLDLTDQEDSRLC